MTREAQFIEAILANPDDESLRLVYADWLEERGDPRGEFIRVQCALAKLPECDEREPQLKAREEALLKEHRGLWTAPLEKLVGDVFACWKFRRGFVEATALTAESFLAHGAALLQAAPIQEVSLAAAEGLVPRLAACPSLARLTTLSVDGPESPEHPCQLDVVGLRALLASPYLHHLATLSIRQNRLGVSGAEALATCPKPPRLRGLDCGRNQMGDAGVCALSSSPLLDGLSRLDLDSNHVGPVGVRALVASSSIKWLRELSLYWNRVGDEGVTFIAASSNLSRLESLSLRTNGLGDSGTAALALSPHLQKLRRLDVSWNPITAKGAQALAASSYLSNLCVLNMRLGPFEQPRPGIGDDGAIAIATSAGLRALVMLDLAGHQISDYAKNILRKRFGDRVIL